MADEPSLTRKEQAERTKQALFEKGRELLRNVNNPDDFVVEDITDACGVSKGTFYLYFKSKGAFFYNVKLAEVQKATRHLVAILQDSSRPARDAILGFVRQWLSYIQAYDVRFGQQWVSLLMDKDSRNTTDPTGLRLYDYPQLIVARVEEGIEHGEFAPDAPPERIAQSVMAVLHGFDAISVITDKGLDFEEWTEDAATIVDDGVLRRWLR